MRRTVRLRRIILLFGAAASVILCSSCEEIPPYAAQLRTAVGYPPAPPPGWWDDAGVSGSPKIVVNIGDQKAYFYKGKHLVGETTVSTGKPGFSTPPGRYQVLSKSPDHVSTLFGDYVDDYGNVVRSNIDSRKDRRPPGTHFDGAQMPYTPCSSEAATRCTRVMFHRLPDRTVHSLAEGNGETILRKRSRRDAGDRE